LGASSIRKYALEITGVTPPAAGHRRTAISVLGGTLNFLYGGSLIRRPDLAEPPDGFGSHLVDAPDARLPA
jgi:hypothetical protein